MKKSTDFNSLLVITPSVMKAIDELPQIKRLKKAAEESKDPETKKEEGKTGTKREEETKESK